MENNQISEFSEQGYRVERLLGHNRNGGRVTYLATHLNTEQLVVIKQFQFAQTGSTWSDYKAHDREIELLQKLDHPSIPKYFSTFETSSGFCLVQEYKNAPSIAQSRHFSLTEVQHIAVSVLEVLIYLQQQVPPVIHRDIKPENILMDEQLKVYLVDFGLAHLGGEELAASSTIKGTLGFIPPEQFFNRQLTEASDLYSLGVTLIGLLTKISSIKISSLIDENYRLNFKHLLPKLNTRLVAWLEKMVLPNPQHRYPNAAKALIELKAIDKISPRAIAPLYSLMAGSLVMCFGLLFVANSLIYRIPEPVNFPITPYKDTIKQLLNTHHCVGCDLRVANLRDADLRSSELTSANLTGADLRGADLRGADLRGANLKDAVIEGANLASADLRNTIMPDGSIHN